MSEPEERHSDEDPLAPAEDGSGPGDESEADGRAEEEPFFSESSALTVMLIVFGVIGGVTLLGALYPRVGEREDERPRVAHGPEDFPDVFAITPLEGLDEPEGEDYPVPRPPFENPEFWPCNACHEGDDVDATPADIADFHPEIDLAHGSESSREFDCFDCHTELNRDALHLADGTEVSFEESYRLCGQCHGTHYRDWRLGIHGRRVGYWDGAKRYLLCVHCHDPHRPRFERMSPLPPPVAPEHIGGASGRASVDRSGETSDEGTDR